MMKNNKYGLLTKREVKMAGYWPRKFLVCVSIFQKNTLTKRYKTECAGNVL